MLVVDLAPRYSCPSDSIQINPSPISYLIFVPFQVDNLHMLAFLVREKAKLSLLDHHGKRCGKKQNCDKRISFFIIFTDVKAMIVSR